MDLYISSYEYDEFAIPKQVLYYRKQKYNDRNILYVKINDPIIGNKYGYNKDINQLILLGRFNDYQLDKLNDFPIDIHVFVYDGENVPWDKLKNIGWACLYDKIEDAKKHKM